MPRDALSPGANYKCLKLYILTLFRTLVGIYLLCVQTNPLCIQYFRHTEDLKGEGSLRLHVTL